MGQDDRTIPAFIQAAKGGLLIDIRHDPSANDKQMYQWMRHYGFDPIIIATKLDKINRSQIQKQLKAIRVGLEAQKDTIIIPYSSLSKQGREEIYDLLDSILSEDGGIKACGDNPENM